MLKRRTILVALCSVAGLMLVGLWYAIHTRSLPVRSEIVEFRTGREGRPLFLVGSVNGQKLTFLLDTGASKTVFDSQSREQLGTIVGQSRANTPGGEVVMDEFQCPLIEFGGLEFRADGPVYCGDLGSIRGAAGEKIDVILGMDILKQLVVQMNFDSGSVRISKQLPNSPDTLGQQFPLSFNSNTPCIEVACGRISKTFMVDTASTEFCIESSFFDSLAASNELQIGPQYAAMAAHGAVSGRIALLRILGLGSFIHEGIVCSESNMNILGLSYLSRYVVTFDFPREVMYLAKGQNYARAEQRGTSGMSFSRTSERLIVQAVKPGGPGESAGVKPGDEVLILGDEDASKVNMFRVRQVLTSEPGTSVPMTVRRGGQDIRVSLLLKDRLGR